MRHPITPYDYREMVFKRIRAQEQRETQMAGAAGLPYEVWKKEITPMGDAELPLHQGSPPLTPLGKELTEMQAQLAHIIALLNTLDRKLDDMADQLGIVTINTEDD